MTSKKEHAPEPERTQTHSQYTAMLARMQPGTQCSRILKYILEHGSITPAECFRELNITRLSARVFDLRNEYGIPVTMHRVTMKTGDGYITYGRYTLEEEQ